MLGYPGSLHNHTESSNFRLRDSINTYQELIDYAVELGHEVIAITEHETVSNAVKVEKYYNKIKKDHPNFKVILGNEIYLVRDDMTPENFEKDKDAYWHFILLAKDAIGHRQIRELSTRAWRRSWTTNKMVRVPTYYNDVLEIIGKEPGHVIGSTACLGSFLDHKILEYNESKDVSLLEKIKNWIVMMQDVFGVGNFYLEMQPSFTEEQIIVNKYLKGFSKELNVPYIITTDSHYCKKSDAPIHKAFLNADDGEREVDSFYASTYLMSTEEIEEYMNSYLAEEDLQYAYNNILDIKNKCEDYSLLKPLRIPTLKWRDIDKTEEKVLKYYLEKMPYLETFLESDYIGDQKIVDFIIDKIEKDVRLKNDMIFKEVNENLKTIWESSNVNKAHWSAYFLNYQKTIDICWEAGTLVGPGRGSGVGFLMLYLLDIIQINSKWETTQTFAWRFLNPSRVSVLDIDTDIESSKRGKVLEALRKYYGDDRVANVVTFHTEGSRSAIQTAGRGLGIDNDVTLYISSLIPKDRGKDRTLAQCYYGDIENDFRPVPLFIQEMNKYPELWQVSQKIEGLISGIGEHAGGVIFVDEPFTNSTALMRAPNGDLMTQFDLHDCEDCSLIKIDLLSVNALDRIHNCLDLLIEQDYIKPEKTLRETYEKYLGVYNLERDASKMWDMVKEHKIQSLFQMEEQSGIQGIALTNPRSVDDLAVLNSVIRLMAQSKDEEQPLNKYARFKNDIGQWYKEMDNYHLTKEEQKLLEPIIGLSYGIAESQEKIMQLVQMPECGGFSLSWADSLRKAVAKKQPEAYLKLQDEFYKAIDEKGLSRNFCLYVWNVLIAMSRGYSFNLSHTLAYSIVALQEMNLAYIYPTIFWDTACLIAESGKEEDEEFIDEEPEEEVVDIYEKEDFDNYDYEDAPDRKTKLKKKKNKSTNYRKIAKAIGKIVMAGTQVMPPDINTSSYTFKPNVENNCIYYGLSGLLNVGKDAISEIIKNRPYSSPKDFINKIKPKKTTMISLIKAGAFDKMMDRKTLLGWYIWNISEPKKKVTLQNMGSLMTYGLLPTDEKGKLATRVYEFNRYLKACCKTSKDASNYYLTEVAIDFLNEIGCEDFINPLVSDFEYINEVNGTYYIINIKLWEKIYNGYMDIIRNFIKENKQDIIDKLNEFKFLELWEKYASKSISAWEMEVMCYYYHDHELKDMNKERYGIVNFFNLPEEPEVESTFIKGDKEIKLFKLSKICGTCISKNKSKGLVTILTTDGVVDVKFNKEYFSMFDRRISEKDEKGTKHFIEKSWFDRGNMIMVTGMRSGEMFISKKYARTGGHQLYRITEVLPNGEIILQEERIQSKDG